MPEIDAPTTLRDNLKPPASTANPLLEGWTATSGVPPFSRITAAHFQPAYAQALAEHATEVAAIAAAASPPMNA